MRRLAPIDLVRRSLSTLSMGSTALAVDRGQFGHVPPDIRAWFKRVIAPNGVPCCDESDGHRTSYDVRAGRLLGSDRRTMDAGARTRGEIRDQGNPIGEAVVWYVHHRGSIIISCICQIRRTRM